MSLFFMPIERAQPGWTPSGCEVHLSDYTVIRLTVSLLVQWLKINKLFNAVSFDVLIVASVIQGGARNVIPLIVHVTHFYYYKNI